MGQIADILYARGDLDEALRIRREEELPVYERLRDIDGIIHVLWSSARIETAKGIADRAAFERILGDLATAYKLAKQLTRLDAICAVGFDLGQLLAMAGAKDQARPLLTEARDGWLRLQQPEIAAQVDKLLQQMDKPDD
jgi:hypothetical protein